jgi:ketosteroid isomerase-like protein
MAISKTCRLVTLALLATAATSLAADPVTDSLVQTERAFAQASVAKGMKDAFLAYLADDSVIFRPAAVPGKAWMQDHPAPPIVLSWRPAYAEVARSGDLGFTTGPYELRSQDPKDTDVGYGTFVTVWKRQAEGAWRVALDLGTSGPQPAEGVSSAVPVEQGTPAAPPGTKGSEAKGEPAASDRDQLLAADKALSAASAAQGTAAAYHAVLAPTIRLLRRGAAPAKGPEAAGADLRRHPGTLTWQPDGGDVSRAGDLGYTYGTAERTGNAPERGVYLRIWERAPGGAWRLVLDLLNPLPPPPPSS